MAAPKGNKFYLRRAKHGPNVIFADPAKLWEAAVEYFAWCDANPLQAIEYNGKDAVKCIVPKMRPYTTLGLQVFLGVNKTYLSDAKARLGKSRKAVDKEMLEVIDRIEQILYVQKFDGAAAGLLHPTIIARSLGLVEKQEVESKNESVITGKIGVTVVSSGIPLANRESDVDPSR